MKSKYVKRKSWILELKAWPAIFLISLSGCSPLLAVPFTLKEVKDYVSGQERSFAYPLNRVMMTTVFILEKDGFTVYRIEHFNQKGLIQAKWQGTSLEFTLDTVTPKMTRVTGRVHSNRFAREYSCEGALFDKIQWILNRERPFNWKEMTEGMVTVHVSPEQVSSVVAYLGEGSKIELLEERGEWGKIALMQRNAGYIPLKSVHLASERDAY